jgi:hypothetical protein
VLNTANGCTSDSSLVTVVTVNAKPSTPTITPNVSAISICQGDSFMITSSALSGNIWSNGDTTRSIYIKSGGNFSVKSKNISGCISNSSNSITATIISKPTAPKIIRYSSNLYADSNSVQWFYNGNPIPGANGHKYGYKKNGKYSCGVKNQLGCWSYSNEIIIGNMDDFEDDLLISTKVSNSAENIFDIYPNPTKYMFYLNLGNNSTSKRVDIVDATGRVVESKIMPIHTHVYEWNLPNLAPGLYYVRVLDGNSIQSKKLVIDR